MTLVIADERQSGPFRWLVKCSNCGKVVAHMTGKEMLGFMAYLGESGEVVLCFTCEEVWEIKLSALRHRKSDKMSRSLV